MVGRETILINKLEINNKDIRYQHFNFSEAVTLSMLENKPKVPSNVDTHAWNKLNIKHFIYNNQMNIC